MIFDLFQDNSSSATSARPINKPEALFVAAEAVLALLAGKVSVSAKSLQSIMMRAFGGTDAEGCWVWKDAYEAAEIALARYIGKYGDTIRTMQPAAAVALLDHLQQLCPTHTKRSDEQQALQQFSTPIGIGYIAALAAGIHGGDTVLEPSAGTGLLAVMAQMRGARLILNELAKDRSAILKRLFPRAALSSHNAEYLADRLDAGLKPTVVLMNPPFSSSPNAATTSQDVTMRHILAALRLLPEKARLVAITGEGFSPFHGKWRSGFIQLQGEASIRFSTGIDGRLYAKHGTTTPTRLTVIDKIPAETPDVFAHYYETQESLPALLDLVSAHCPSRQDGIEPPLAVERPVTARLTAPLAAPAASRTVVELEYTTRDWLGGLASDGLYESYEPQTVQIPGASAHPSPLVQSAAMASIAPPRPSYRPHLYSHLVGEAGLSAAQLESVIYAGEAHSEFLTGHFRVGPNGSTVRCAADAEDAVRFRRGWYLGDGTGCGKGRQVAGIILDNWLKGRRRAVWVSKNDKLLEDARRDWTALGGKESDIVPQWKFKQGTEITLSEGILFTTYSTLRGAERGGKDSRLRQLVKWLGDAFDGPLMFDEAHAMANAVAAKGSRGVKKPSAQGLAGVELQNALPAARVVYVSATGATEVSNLAYAARLGLWGTDEMPFATQSDFVAEMEKGGIAAMEMISRDLKALGLYTARSLSYEGVRYEFLEHQLTEQQVAIYDQYAEAYQVIHHNIEDALFAVNINNATGKARNGMAKAAVRSAFESCKQRFFNHLLVSMKCPTLIASIQQRLDEGHACVVQIVSTNEALLERRLAELPVAEWRDLNIDLTPREYVMDYLRNAFPVHLHEVYTDEEGNETTRVARDEAGNPVLSRYAVAKRDALIEQLALLPAIPGAVDQIIQHFGHDQVAEVTGRSRRVIRVQDGGRDRLCVQNRPASSNLTETAAFQDDTKRILLFSDAGGTGRSYHADKNCKNQRLRYHFLLESGWKADSAIQGIGRTNRTNQAQPPVFVPVASDVRGEKRFLSTIARRLDTLGAITRGQRQTGGQGLFREEDNLESDYAKAALRELYRAITHGKIACCSLDRFCAATGLALTDEHGALLENLPPITQFLNRVLALPIQLQNDLFDAFTLRMTSRIEQAREAGTYEAGVESLVAEGFQVLDRKVLYSSPASTSETLCSQIERRERAAIMSVDAALALYESGGRLVRNEQSGRVAVATPTNSFIDEMGNLDMRVQLHRPLSRNNSKLKMVDFEDSGWKPIAPDPFRVLWQQEADAAPAFVTSTFYLITGLLLPVWKKLPSNTVSVRRLTTDDGQTMLGRMVDASDIEAVWRNFGMEGDGAALSAHEIVQTVLQRRQPYQLRNGIELRSSLVMGQSRLELAKFDPAQKDRLVSLGCFSEIISWKVRIFVPVNDNTPGIIEQLLMVA